MNQKTPPSFLFLFLSFGMICSCSKNTNSAPAIGAINPTHGSVGETVTITGSDFGTSPSVSFNGKMAPVINAGATQLQVTVPSLCGTGTVKVSSDGQTASGPIFTYDTTYNPTSFATGLSGPQYLTIDGAGNLYVTNYGNATIAKISPAGVVSTFYSGLNGPSGITVDSYNNIYVATNNNTNQSSIVEITPSGTASPFATITGYIYDLTIDNLGNLYATNAGYGSISKVSSLGVASTFASGMPFISGITIGSDGTLYATGSTNGAVYKITPQGAVTTIATGFSFGGPNGIAVDKSNNLYITVFGNNTLSQYNTVTKIAASGTISTVATGLDVPCGLIFDGSGNFYVVDAESFTAPSGTVFKLTIQ
jgi:sugar lactone lactonase YvrE